MAATVQPGDDEPDTLGLRAASDGRSMPEAAQQVTCDEMEHRDPLEQVLGEQLPRYAEALRRLAE